MDICFVCKLIKAVCVEAFLNLSLYIRVEEKTVYLDTRAIVYEGLDEGLVSTIH